jgi:hypothetical protein
MDKIVKTAIFNEANRLIIERTVNGFLNCVFNSKNLVELAPKIHPKEACARVDAKG